MKNNKFYILACILPLILATDAFQNENSDVKDTRVNIKAIVGEVFVRNVGSQRWRRARVGMKLAAGSEIMTEKESSVELWLDLGGVINIGESSVITLSDLLLTDNKDDNTNKVDNKETKATDKEPN